MVAMSDRFSQIADKFASSTGLSHAHASVQNMVFVFLIENEQQCHNEQEEMM